MKDLSVIIPVYNEANNIHALIGRLKSSIDPMNVSCEYIFINDGSSDQSIALIKDLAEKDTSIKYIDLSRNFGHQIAVSAGIDKSSGNTVVIIDADLQDPPELIPEMYATLNSGYQVVYAKRKQRAGESFLKRWTAKMFYRILARITNIQIPVDTGDFRIVDKKIIDILKKMPEQQKFLRGQISWIGYKQTFIEYERQKRNAGNTGYTYKKMIRFALDGITSFSNFPLKFATVAGFAVSIISFFLILYALYSRLVSKNYVSGWASLMISVLFLGGIQLISIGIIGEYISRMSANVRNRPLYIIGETNINS